MAAPEDTRVGKGPEGVQEGEVRTHKDLELWKAAMELAKAVYQVTARFPKEEVYGMTAQMRRSAVSIPCNIAQGAARHSKKEFIQFLYVALGSLAELETQWILAGDLGLARDEGLETKIELVRKLLLGLLRHFKQPPTA
ncbi:four helix bundle protein [Desulfacinum infernum DSM 9756]|uniref:Four helix bundle protein n=1 Tax=Desulfacinum infernum DSM 9756 TaxID=1121391 RepID=A0A1M5FNJ2_9BACT|nr:four helix bundle protein [Desulfacinum infernum]SHF93063.1 four helix bundle protein [Desulfacinum infernum DSM 9756]